MGTKIYIFNTKTSKYYASSPLIRVYRFDNEKLTSFFIIIIFLILSIDVGGILF